MSPLKLTWSCGDEWCGAEAPWRCETDVVGNADLFVTDFEYMVGILGGEGGCDDVD